MSWSPASTEPWGRAVFAGGETERLMSLPATLRRLYALLPGPKRRQVWPLLLLMVVNAFSEVSGVASLLPFAAVASDPSLISRQPVLHWIFQSTGQPDPHLFLLYLGSVFLLLLVVTNLLNALTFWFSLRFSLQFGSWLSGRLLSSYLSRPFLFFLQKNNADLASMVLSEVDSLADMVVLAAAELITTTLIVLFLVIGLLWIDPQVALTTTLLLSLLYGLIYRAVRQHSNWLAQQRVSSNSARYRAVHEALSLVREARSFTRAPLFLAAYLCQSRRYGHYRVMERLVTELPRYATETLAVMSIGLILIYLVFRGQSSQQAIPLVCLYIMAALRLVPSAQKIYRSITRIRFHAPVLALIQNELRGGEGLPESAVRDRLPLRQQIRVRSASFTYPGNRQPALDNVSLEIPRGSVVALVGRTGAGKSTLADVLAGLLPLDSGSVEVDGQALTRENHLDWLDNVGYVPQEIFLTDNTVSCNVALGYAQEHIEQEAVRRAARTARMATFVEGELAQGYDTRLGERGVTLSGGQRQRVGIARALYNDPELLIMDEATSALDTMTEREVMEAIQELAGQKTLVLIAHRLTTVQLCQKIFLLENGKLIAQGTYEDLLRSSPEFSRLAHTVFQA